MIVIYWSCTEIGTELEREYIIMKFINNPNKVRKVVELNLNREIGGVVLGANGKVIPDSVIIDIKPNESYKDSVYNVIIVALPSDTFGEPHNIYTMNSIDGGVLNIGSIRH